MRGDQKHALLYPFDGSYIVEETMGYTGIYIRIPGEKIMELWYQLVLHLGKEVELDAFANYHWYFGRFKPYLSAGLLSRNVKDEDPGFHFADLLTGVGVEYDYWNKH